MSCLLVQDLVEFADTLGRRLPETSDIMSLLKPKLKLVGSVPEGTRCI